MASSDLLTYLLPLYGRSKLTSRWLNYASRESLSSPVYVADGKPSDSPFISPDYRLNFPNLRISYVEYCDTNIRDYFRKLYHALSTIKTPYVVLCDNDDFPCFDALLRCVNFLELNTSYACAGGQVAGIHGPSSRLGSILRRFTYLSPCISKFYIENYWYFCRNIDDESPFSRVHSQIIRPLSVYYYVHRTSVIKECYEFLSSLDEPMLVSETVLNSFVALSGKIRSDPENLILVREVGTSLESGDLGNIKSLLSSPQLHSTLASVSSFLSSSLHATDPSAPAEVIQHECTAYHYTELFRRLKHSSKKSNSVFLGVRTLFLNLAFLIKIFWGSICYLFSLRIKSSMLASTSVRNRSSFYIKFFKRVSSYYK